jgi:hypothetical protein
MAPPSVFFRLLAVLLLCSPVLAQATTVVPPSFPELSQKADYVVRARVTAVRHETRERNGRAVPYTKVELEILEVIAGEPPRPLVLTMLGGRVGDGELVVLGAPTFAVGDEDILFIRGNGRNFHPLFAMMHGRYPVKRDKATGREFIARSNGVPMEDVAEVATPMTDAGAAQLQQRARKAADALSPSEFAELIRVTRNVTPQREK